MFKNSIYIVKLDSKIAGAIGNLCPQQSIGCSLAKFIEVQYDALEREHNELICQDCIVSLPAEIVDALDRLYPYFSFSDQVIKAVRALVDLSACDAVHLNRLYPVHSDHEDIAYYRDICNAQIYYASGGERGNEADI